MRNAEMIATLYFSDKSTIDVFYRLDDSGMASGDAQDFILDILEQAVSSSDVFLFCVLLTTPRLRAVS